MIVDEANKVLDKQDYLEKIRKFIPELEGFNREMSIDELKQLLEYLKAGNYKPRTVKSMGDKRIKIPKLGSGWLIILGLGVAALLFYLVRITFLG